jgi:hypothetical protein
MGDYLGTVSFLKQVAVNRAETLMRARLLIRPSELRRLNPRTKQYDMLMGNRLFSKERIQRGQQIVHFSGEPLRSRAEVQHARAVSLHGGYVITNHTETYGLDCFQAAARHQCFASMANCPYKCKNVVRGTFPEANVQKTCKALGDGTYSFGLVACRDIPPFTEILVNYGASYLYPTHYDD